MQNKEVFWPPAPYVTNATRIHVLRKKIFPAYKCPDMSANGPFGPPYCVVVCLLAALPSALETTRAMRL